MSVSLKKSNITSPLKYCSHGLLIPRDGGLVRSIMDSETTILGSTYIPVFYSVYTINNVTLYKINFYRHLKQSEIFWLSFDCNIYNDQWKWSWALPIFSLRFWITLLFKISMLERMFDLQSMFWRMFLS